MLNSTDKRILGLALPNIITNITVPLLGMVDLMIVGHIGDQLHIGAIAIGTMIFNFIYWNFGFLRMGTSGLAAQAYGAKKLQEAISVLVRGMVLAMLIAMVLIIFQYPLGKFSLWLIDGNMQMEDLAYQYFKIRIWAAPATLGMYVIKGWFIGMQNAKTPMMVAIGINVLNILFSLLFVMVFDMQIEGVAYGTLLAQWSGMLISILLWIKYYGKLAKYIHIAESLHWQETKSFFRINSDIFLRSLCLVAVFSFLPIAGAKMGDEILAANTLLLQYFTLFSYIMDGFAYAGESLTGKYIGSREPMVLKRTIRHLFYWGVMLSALFTVVYAFGGDVLLKVFTDKQNIIEASHPYYFWVLMVPFAGFAAFLWDGIYIGATASKEMRNCMFIATLLFFVMYYGLVNFLGNNALWSALIVFLLLRGILQKIYARQAVYVKAFN